MARLCVEILKNGLIRQVFSAGKLKCLESRLNFISGDTIDFLLLLIKHPILVKYPLRYSYFVVLFKRMFSRTEIEESDVTEEQIDAMYYRYGQLLLPSPLEPIFYKHYIIDDAKDLKPGVTFDSVITIEENNSIVSEGTTGLHTWEAGVALGVWCFRNQDKLQDKFIVELGSGTGLSGISVCVYCKPRKYWFTDCHPSVLKVIKSNIDNNKLVHSFNCPYEVIKLSWENVEECEMFDEEKPDLVLAADVIYDPTMFDSLCKSLKYFMTNNTTEIMLFSTVRNPETHQTFLKTLGEYDLDFTDEILPDNYSMIVDQNCPIHIINIKQKY